LISDKYKYIFIHIPKAAGQSIERFFLQAEGLTWESRASLLLRPNHDRNQGPPYLAHLTAEEYTRLGYINAEKFSTYYKFAFVRNPWARMVSEYSYRKKQWKFLFCTFEEFLTTRLPTSKDDDYGRTPDDLYRHILPQAAFVYDEKNNLLADFIGRVENIQDDFKKIAKHIQLSDYALQHINQTTHRAYKDYYNPRTKNIVADLYKRDIELFEYRF
jgi:hypothetical protein